ncbi:MAG: DUF2341 domain-containing protein [Rhodocyclaceae bacterium]|nr:MAG: DUF2341 domain-containing protein [Rhodocyclaceae bacterium]
MMRLFAYLFAALLALPAMAESFPGDWSHKTKINLDTTASGVELKNGVIAVPVAVRLHTGNFTFAEAKPDGSDLRVAAADGKTPLKFHVESYDATNELAVLWVQLPKLSANAKNDAFWLYWGNAKAEAVDGKGSYDPAQALVLHFSEADGPKDVSGGNNVAKAKQVTLGAVGPLGGAASFDGKSEIAFAASPSLRVIAANGFTMTAWIKPADVNGGTLFSQVDGARRLSVGLAGGTLSLSVNGKEMRAQAPLQVGAWQHVAVSIGGGKATLFVNGAEAGTVDAPVADMGGDVAIGSGYRGDLDEVTVASTARSADYIKALYGSQQPDGALLSFGEGDEGGGESVSYFSILLGAVTIDGWVVIGILIVMGVISFAVMVGKARFLSRVRKGNAAFLERFKEAPEALLTPGTSEVHALAAAEEVRHSPIYRLYAIGLHEIKHRFENQAKAGREKSLSAAALDSVRAAMDAAMVREGQRINSQIVLLTIAISGGPFLGLLGTVVGVMITFAAIAAAGDVNVNSIAPGIAAALVATVAGLGVAIPALFGYNWLAAQIKNATADTQVFADEFLTKAAELHSR